MRGRRIPIAALLVLAALLAAPARGAAGPAGEVVEHFHTALLGVMKNAVALGYQGRYERLSPVLDKAFHLPFMTQIIAGRHWKKFTDPEKIGLIRAFSRMTKSTYARRFDGFGGEIFRNVEEVEIRTGTLLVRTELVKKDGEIVRLDYLMRNYDGAWRVIDVQLKGSYSELATKRSEYARILRSKGVAALTAELNAKVAADQHEATAR